MAKKVVFKVNTGDPEKKSSNQASSRGNTQIDRDFDLRDRLAELVGKGNALSQPDREHIYGSLSDLVGQESAARIIQHAFLFNARPDVQALPVEEKLKSFYTIGSNDPSVQRAINKTKALGYGVVPGFRTSSSALNQEVAGRIAPVDETATAEVKMPARVPAAEPGKKKVMFKVQTRN